MFVVDSSGSIGFHNYQLVKNYLRAYTRSLLSSNSSSRVGVILFSTRAQVEIGLEFVITRGPQALLTKISNLRYIKGGTNTPDGLCLLKALPWRRSASVLRVAVVITDGKSGSSSNRCRGNLRSTAADVHRLRPPVTVFAVGVGNYDRAELNTIATSPQLVDELTHLMLNFCCKISVPERISSVFRVSRNRSILIATNLETDSYFSQKVSQCQLEKNRGELLG